MRIKWSLEEGKELLFTCVVKVVSCLESLISLDVSLIRRGATQRVFYIILIRAGGGLYLYRPTTTQRRL